MAPRNQRWWLTEDSEELVINASPEHLYQMVADLSRMGEWSPECQSVEWEDGDSGAAEGARFVGHNRGGPGGLMRWSRRGRVLSADPGREFAFATEEGGHESTVWRYRFEPVAGGTQITESYEVKRIPAWARILDVPTNRHRELLEGMRHTLQQLKTAAEAMSPASDQP
jgi:uncharacterized protein YndB with AHSA1/START domain